MRRALLLISLAAATGPAYADEDSPFSYDPSSGWFMKPQDALPLPYAERPLTVPRRHYRLSFDLSVTQVDDGKALTRFSGLGGYGMTRDFELGARALDWTFSADRSSGLGLLPAVYTGGAGPAMPVPGVYALFRLLEGDVEAAVHLETSFPFAPMARVGLPLLFRLGKAARIDLTPFARGELDGDGYLQLTELPVRLSVQLGAGFRLAAGATLHGVDLARHPVLELAGEAGAHIAWANKLGLAGELSFVFTSPRVELAGTHADPDGPRIGRWPVGLLRLELFIFSRPDNNRMEAMDW